jgi:double-stranded uracil-DNA glycosylase
MTVLQGLPALVNARTRLLVLGSFPGVRSLEAQQYYAHPQNAFWRIQSALFGIDFTALAYAQRVRRLLAQGVGLWDVYASCERSGSLDSAIRNAVPNDFASLRKSCPKLRAICHNGSESAKHAQHAAALGCPVIKLPSTSPANARWSFEQKLQAWREAFAPHLGPT